MLKFFSRLERTRNAVLIVFAVIMVASLVLFYAPTPNQQELNLSRSTETVAKVGGETVALGEVANISQIYSGAIPAEQILDSLIPSRIVRQEAERLGLTASDAELRDQILKLNKPADGSAFDKARYEQNVTEQFGSVKAYEQSVRDQLSGQKLEAFITSGVNVSEEDVLNDFKRKNTRFDLSFVPVSVRDLAENLNPSDEELKNYFEQNKKNYYISLPQKKIRYVFLSTSKIGEKLTIPDGDLQAEYDKLTPERKQAGVNGQQIVLRVARPELDESVLAKASEIAARAQRENGKISEEAFAELAKGQSEDPQTAQNGGRIAGLVKPNPNNPTDPYQQLLQLEEGEVTEPIKFGTSYYILRRGAAVAKSFEDAKKEIEVSLRNRRAYAATAELAQKVTDDLKQTKDVQKTAATFAAQANAGVQDMVRETPFVKPGDEVPNVGISPQFEEGISPLENQGQVGEKIPIKDGFAIPMLVDKREPHDAALEEVKDRVVQDYKLAQARNNLEQTAKDIAAGAGSVANLAAAAQSKGLKAQDSKSFILGSPLGQGAAGATSEALEDAIYGLKAGEVTKAPIKVGDSWYVVGVTNRTEANLEDFVKQRDELVETMLLQKRGQVFSDYLANVRRRMEADGQIKIYKDALDKLAPTTEATPEG
jgi:peptidyl-prolyl cis-trans isomerase D